MNTFWALNPLFAEDSKKIFIFSCSANFFAVSVITVLLSSKSHLFPIKKIWISGLEYALNSFNQSLILSKEDSLV